MGRIKVRYFVAKRQKGHVLFYWQPSRALRAAGFLTRRLAEKTNDFSDAVREAERLNAELDAWRGGKAAIPNREGTLPWLIALYMEDERYTQLRPASKQEYDYRLRRIDLWSERAGHPPITSISRKAVKTLYRSIAAPPPQGGGKLALARSLIKVLRILFSFAKDEGLVAENPAEKQRIKGSRPRHQVWQPEQIEAVIAAATAHGYRSIALAVALAANVGQREGDLLRMTWSQYDGSSITLKQSKTGMLLSVPCTAQLRRILDATPRQSPTMVMNDATGRPWSASRFRHQFREAATAAGISYDLQFRDLRRTAVVRLAEAGCSVPEIAAISGHELNSTLQILETYLPRNTEMARNAITKLEEHRAARANTAGTKLED